MLICVLLPIAIFAQKNYSLGGYVKLLGSFNNVNPEFIPEDPLFEPFKPLLPTTSQDYQIHNRFNFKWYGPSGFTAGIGMRNRLFWGYQIRSFYNNQDLYSFIGIQSFEQLVDFNNYLDLSILWYGNENSVLYSVFDRMWLQWEGEKIRARVGRQRINWGINNAFNPNDLFNQYNFFDFDYEERPGTDAVLLQYYTSSLSSIEAAFTPGPDSIQQSVGAMLFRMNKFKYDWQFLAGYFKRDLALGMGWAGNIGNAGFKGETTYFLPIQESLSEENFVSSISIDYSFKNGIYLMGGYLFNQMGSDEPSALNVAFIGSAELTAKNIFPYQNSLMLTASKNITPLFTANLSWIQTPNFKNIIMVPSLTYSILANLDFMVLGQLFFTEHPTTAQLGFFSSSIFTRLKYSF